jgi:cupin fold WbuC family metalloprotein
MFNAIRTDSYARPHRHSDPDKTEVFIVMRGVLLVVRFSDDGTPAEGVLIKEEGPVKGVEIPAGAWHTVVSLDDRSVAFEAMHGPYDPSSHKHFAPWAPPEGDRRAGLAFIAGLRAHFAATIPEVAALNLIAEEEKDVF